MDCSLRARDPSPTAGPAENPQTYPGEEHLVGVFGVGDELGGFKAGHGFPGAGSMPDMTTPDIVLTPVCFGNPVGNGMGSQVLIPAHHLKYTVGARSNMDKVGC